MRTLVIDTATAACSIALVDNGAVVARSHEVVGRGHAERLVPMIAELPDGGRADRILVDVGPGSFTGVRVGLAAAQGLAFGWGVPVRGYSSLALVAAAALRRRPDLSRVAAVLEAGHGEVFVQIFSALPAAQTLAADAPPASLSPVAAATLLAGLPAIGSGVGRLAGLVADATDALPDAGEVTLLPPTLADLPPVPLYGRAPDAALPAARATASSRPAG